MLIASQGNSQALEPLSRLREFTRKCPTIPKQQDASELTPPARQSHGEASPRPPPTPPVSIVFTVCQTKLEGASLHLLFLAVSIPTIRVHLPLQPTLSRTGACPLPLFHYLYVCFFSPSPACLLCCCIQRPRRSPPSTCQVLIAARADLYPVSLFFGSGTAPSNAGTTRGLTASAGLDQSIFVFLFLFHRSPLRPEASSPPTCGQPASGPLSPHPSSAGSSAHHGVDQPGQRDGLDH